MAQSVVDHGHLFNLYFATLDIGHGRACIIFYADDLVVVCLHPWAVTSFLHELKKISDLLNITWNPSKCKVMQMSSNTTHNFRWYGKLLENLSRLIYLGWLIVRKTRNVDDDQAARQAGRFYAAAHEITQSYGFVSKLPWQERVNFAKCFGAMYAPEAYTSVSEKAISKLRAAHRYLCMKVTGWNGIESVEGGSTVSSCTIGSDDSDEEYYDTRSRWLYAYAATNEKKISYRQIRSCGDLDVDLLHAAPTIGSQLRQASYRIKKVTRKLGIPLDSVNLKLSKSIMSIIKPFCITSKSVIR